MKRFHRSVKQTQINLFQVLGNKTASITIHSKSLTMTKNNNNFFSSFYLFSASVPMLLRLLISRMMMMMMMMMSLLIVTVSLGISIVNNELATVSFDTATIAATVIVPITRFIHRFFATKWRIIRSCR